MLLIKYHSYYSAHDFLPQELIQLIFNKLEDYHYGTKFDGIKKLLMNKKEDRIQS